MVLRYSYARESSAKIDISSSDQYVLESGNKVRVATAGTLPGWKETDGSLVYISCLYFHYVEC